MTESKVSAFPSSTQNRRGKKWYKVSGKKIISNMNEHAAREISHDDEKQKFWRRSFFLHSAKMKNFPTSSAISATFYFHILQLEKCLFLSLLPSCISTTAITVCCVQNVGKKESSSCTYVCTKSVLSHIISIHFSS